MEQTLALDRVRNRYTCWFCGAVIILVGPPGVPLFYWHYEKSFKPKSTLIEEERKIAQ